jgi:hypothetical protein
MIDVVIGWLVTVKGVRVEIGQVAARGLNR